MTIDELLSNTREVALYSLYDLLPIHFSWCNQDGHIIDANNRTLDFFRDHANTHDIIGKQVKEIISDSAWQNTYTVLKTGISISAEETHTDSKGNKTYFISLKSPIKSKEDEVIGVVNIAIDITDRKVMEARLLEEKAKAEAASKAKTDFLANMRHDLRTPLSGILGMAQLLIDNENDPEKKENITDIFQSSESLLNHLNEIIKFVEVDKGDIPLIKKPFSVEEKIKDVFAMLKPSAKEKGLEFTNTAISPLPQKVLGDPTRFQRILMNVVANAIKFTNKGFVKIETEWLPEQDPTYGIFKILIKDSGIGIKSSKKEMIFEKFTRGTPSYTGVYEGNGLGLNIVKRFLEEIDGECSLESLEERGTEFTILIPYKISLFNKVEEKANRILLVEDHNLVGKASKRLIENSKTLNANVDVVETGAKALSSLEKDKYDLILMDIGLPDMTGYEVTQKIRAHKDECIANIPIVALTAHEEEEAYERCIAVGMDDFLKKPLTPSTIKDIEGYLSLRRANHADTVT